MHLRIIFFNLRIELMNREIVKADRFLKKIGLKFFRSRICKFSKFLFERLFLFYRASKRKKRAIHYSAFWWKILIVPRDLLTMHATPEFIYPATVRWFPPLMSSIKVSRINPKSAMPVFVKRARWILWRERKATGLV